MNKRFEYPAPKIPKTRLITGIAIGFFFSFSFYTLLYVMREYYRILPLIYDFEIWILSPSEVRFYNLFYAYLALITGQSVCFLFLANRPRQFLQPRSYLQKVIVTDARSLNMVFLNWFSKLAVLFVFYFGLTVSGGFYAFSLYPGYCFLFVLLILVLFLQPWVTLLRIYKRKAIRYMLINFAVMSVLAVGFSFINLIDYKSVNRFWIECMSYYPLKHDIPHINSTYRFYEDLHYYNFVSITQNRDDESPVIIIKKERIPFSEFNPDSLKASFDFDDYTLLDIDKDIKMKHVHEFQQFLCDVNESFTTNVGYAYIPLSGMPYDRAYFPWRFFKHDAEMMAKFVFQEIIMDVTSHSYSIKGETCSLADLPGIIRDYVKNTPDYLIVPQIDGDVSFGNYLTVLSGIRNAIDTLREEYALEHYAKNYELLTDEETDEVRLHYPLAVNVIYK